MGFRFRRSIPIVSGVRINLGLKSASASFGIPGLRYTAGTAGQRVTAGLPGTGLSWTTALRSGSAVARIFLTAAGILLLLALMVAAFAH